MSSDEEATTTQAQLDTTGAVSGGSKSFNSSPFHLTSFLPHLVLPHLVFTSPPLCSQHTDIIKDISFAPTVTKLVKGTRPTPHRVACIIHAFRMRLGRIGGVTTNDFDKWLADQDWEVDLAIDIFLQITVPAARKADEDNEPGRSPLQQQKDHMLAGAAYSRHGNHRRTISVLYEMFQALFPGDVITVMRIANLLRETIFDYEEAIMIHEQRRGNAAELAEIERAERRLCMPGPGGGEPTQVHKDNRVQVFLEVAGTDDWVSARNFLSSAANAWNLGLAMDRWMQSGFRTTRPTPTESRRLRYRAPQLSHLEQDNLWPPPRPLFQMTTADATDIVDSTEDYGTGSYVGENSRYINLDPYRAVVGINRPDLLEQFHINRGKGTVIPMLAAGIPEGNSMVPMSFLNSRHITILNKTYLQNPSRSGGISKRQAGIRYTHGECDWMYSWHEDRVMAYQAQNPGFVLPADQTWKDVVDFDADELTEDLNSEFQGRVTIGSPAPRPERERSSVDLRRKRIQILCTDFGFDFSPIR
jgi:hypothetical protein